MANYISKTGQGITLWDDACRVIKDDVLDGPTGKIGCVIVETGNSYDVYTSTESGGGYASLGEYTLEVAAAKQQRQVRTLRICQLWDAVPGLQWKGQSDWDAAADAWLTSNVA